MVKLVEMLAKCLKLSKSTSEDTSGFNVLEDHPLCLLLSLPAKPSGATDSSSVVVNSALLNSPSWTVKTINIINDKREILSVELFWRMHVSFLFPLFFGRMQSLLLIITGFNLS